MQISDGYILISKVEYEQLHKEIEQLRKTVEIQVARVKELEGMLHKDSHNSHKPPSSNEFKKIKNNRIKGEHFTRRSARKRRNDFKNGKTP